MNLKRGLSALLINEQAVAPASLHVYNVEST